MHAFYFESPFAKIFWRYICGRKRKSKLVSLSPRASSKTIFWRLRELCCLFFNITSRCCWREFYAFIRDNTEEMTGNEWGESATDVTRLDFNLRRCGLWLKPPGGPQKCSNFIHQPVQWWLAVSAVMMYSIVH